MVPRPVLQTAQQGLLGYGASGQSAMEISPRSIPGMQAHITDAVSGVRLNIENWGNKARGNHAYTILDAGSAADGGVRLI